jgi:integrase
VVRERVADGIYKYALHPKDGKKAEVRYGATVWVRGPWGERVQKRKHGFATEKAAKTWRAQEIAASASGLAATGGEMKLGVWVQQYLALHQPTWTYGTYRNAVNNLQLFAPLFGLPLRKVGPAEVQSLLVSLIGRYQPGTIRLARQLFSRCLNRAVEFGLITRNPVRATKAPQGEGTKPDYWTAAEVGRLLAVTDGQPDAALWRLLAEGWLRVGEACGLTWADVDLAAGRVHIRRTVQTVKGGVALADRPKTRHAVRTVPISAVLVRQLREMRDRDRLACGRAWSVERVVFGHDGAVRNTSWTRKRLHALCRLAGLPLISPHKLRHAGASIAMRSKAMDPEVAKERLGHHSAAFMYDHYVHPNEDDHREAADAFAELISGGS